MTRENAAASSPASQRLLTVEEVAERLQISTYGVRDRVLYGAIPHVRLGHSIRVRPVDVDAYTDRYGTGPR